MRSNQLAYCLIFTRSLHRQRGASMIEILVTLIVAAIGVLGLSGMQLLGAKNVASSNYRSLATIYAYDMAERMRSNADAAANYPTANYSSTTAINCSAGCSSAAMAKYDAYEWVQQITANPVDGGLPGGSGEVTGANPYTITVSWSETFRDANGVQEDQVQSYSLEVQL